MSLVYLKLHAIAQLFHHGSVGLTTRVTHPKMVTQLTRDPLTHFHLWSVLRSSCREAVYVFALELDSFRILIVH